MPFQSLVQRQPSPGVVGAIASMNPLATVDAGPGGLVAAAAGVVIGRFAWNVYPTAGGPGVAQNSCPFSASVAPYVPDGFLSNQQQGLITVWLGEASLVVPGGKEVTEHRRGDFWAHSTLSEALINQKVFANLLSGQVLAANAGAVPVNPAGSAGVVVATTASLTNYTMTIASVTSGVVAVGQAITGPGIPEDTYIESFGTFNGTSGTVFLNRNPITLASGKNFSVSSPEGAGGFTGTASFATNVMTIVSVTNGSVEPGMLVTSAGVTAGTYVLAQITGTPGGIGTYSLSTSPGTITVQAATATAWIETDWKVRSAGNVMDLIKIGRE